MRRPSDPNETTYEVTPLKIDDSLFICTPHNFVIALDAETGEERWRFDPEVPDSTNRQHLTCRGLSYHASQTPVEGQACQRRLFMPTADARLIALDPETGKVCESFGENGDEDIQLDGRAERAGAGLRCILDKAQDAIAKAEGFIATELEHENKDGRDAWKKTTRKLTGDIGVTFYDMYCGAYDQHLDKMSIEDHKDPSTVDWWR